MEKMDEKCNYYLCDVYSLGIIALRMCGISFQKISSIPKEESLKDIHGVIMDKFCKEIEGLYSKKFLELLLKMTEYEPNKRIQSIKEIIYNIEN